MLAVGIDVGGTGVKGALVDVREGRLAGERIRVPTPHPATPEAVRDVVIQLLENLDPPAGTPVGITVPAVVIHGVVQTATNIDLSWIGVDAATLFGAAIPGPFSVLNDADAAGLAEVSFGAAADVPGVVMVITLGTGIGVAMVVDGRLVPNSELGHLRIHGRDMCFSACAKVRKDEDLAWAEWAGRVEEYLRHLEDLTWPDLFVIGGGVSRKSQKFLPLIRTRTPIVPARLLNDGGIIGAATVAGRP
jgi:polyphosphate glucokinase